MNRSLPRTRLTLAASLLVYITIFSGGCDSRTTSPQAPVSASAPASEWDVIVEPRWVEEQWRKHAVLIVDAREPSEYAEGHIPGAVNIPVSATYDDHSGNTRNLARVARIEQLLGSAGVSHRVPVIVYDDRDYREAARMFWVLEVHGHTHAAVLNGGYSGWKAQHLPVTAMPTIPRPMQFIASLQPKRMSSKLQVLQMIGDEQTLLLDSRSEDEYQGLASETSRAGHIPSAVNMDSKSNLAASEHGACRLRDFDELGKLYADIPQDQRIVSYCTSGRRASLSYLVLRSLGHDAAIYDGSWAEWSADPNLPIETGPYTAVSEGDSE